MKSNGKLGLKAFRQRLVAGSFPQYAGLPDALAGLQFIQADPIRSPARAQDLILRQRVDDYRADDLEHGFPQLDAEEGYLFAYGFMKPAIWRDLHRRPRARLNAMKSAVRDAVAELGEAHPRALHESFGKRRVRNAWGGKSQATKRVLEDLHDEGFLRVCRREKGVRIYQVAATSNDDGASPKERYARLAVVTARVFGPTSTRFLIAELAALQHLLPKRGERASVIEELVRTGQLAEVEVDGARYLWMPGQWQAHDVPDRVRILAPFDPLVRDRQRFEQVWAWQYRFEAYTPAAKRQRGYYAMPLLWRDQIIGWANARVEAARLKVELGYIKSPPRSRAYRHALDAEIEAMTTFVHLESGSWEIGG